MNQTQGGPFQGMPTDPTAMVNMMKDLYQKALKMVSNGDTAKLPMDPTQFMKTFEQLIQNMSQGGAGNMPTNPTAMMGYFQDMFKRMSGSNGEMLDPQRFFAGMKSMFGETPFKEGGGMGNMMDMMNPVWWMKMGQETMQKGMGSMTGQQPGGPTTQTEGEPPNDQNQGV